MNLLGLGTLVEYALMRELLETPLAAREHLGTLGRGVHRRKKDTEGQGLMRDLAVWQKIALAFP